MKPRVLLVDDERAIRLSLTGLLEKEGYEVVAVGTYEESVAAIDEGVDLVLTDLALGKGEGGLEVLRAAKRQRDAVPVVMITAYGSEKIAVEAMKAGADDYIPKPFDNDEIRLLVRRLLKQGRAAREHEMLLARVARDYGDGAIVGAGRAMRGVLDAIARVADTDLSVLVRGESGTGKELVAQALHQRGRRARRPFVAVNSAAIHRELVESELFGHEKGAFTGASARRIGRFESADGGTIFLDEIGDMPLETQAKVLRVLEERRIERVGGARPIDVDVRVVAATHRDLEADVERGRFRRDLYYRLRVVEIVLPPLRERLEDIPEMAERFLEKVAARHGRPKRSLSASAMAALARHSFPGNVRELRNVLEHAAVLAEGERIDASDLHLDAGRSHRASAYAQGASFADAKKRAIEEFERGFLVRALRDHDGNVSRTAEAIGMVRQSLQQKLRELGIRAAAIADGDDEA
jgi:DNA-binding NtrC family response regulator